MKKITFAAAILLLMAILIIISISYTDMLGVNLLNHIQETNNSPEIERIDWGQKAREIALKDERVQELIDGGPCPSAGGIIWNETYAELFFRIGGKHHEIITSNTSKEGHIVGGEIYKIAIDLNNETVLSIKKEINHTIDWPEVICESVSTK
ncbi:MAG: hypothetical protein U9N36_01700 [Euryarchaeota archaeon]|nr:hypothetical protein [Euryarchaeota archaeon]